MFRIIQRFQTFLRDRKASTGIVFSLSIVPVFGLTGASVDLSRAISAGDKLQAAVDAATLSGAILATQNPDALAMKTFRANFLSAMPNANPSANFTTIHDSGYGRVFSGQASVDIPATVLKIIGINSIRISRKARASFGTGDTSCILTLGGEMDLDDNSMVFNGNPAVNLTGCTIRSNQAIKCNGNSVQAEASIAATLATNCPNPVNNAGQMPDIYKVLASNITKQCGSDDDGVTWSTGSVPSGPNVINYTRTGYRVVHVCGDLRLEGVGALAGTGGTDDLVIVVENGDLIVDHEANITATNTTFIFTAQSDSHVIDFPNGNGHYGRLSITSSTNAANPWRGIAVYQDPRLTSYVSQDWGPGARFVFDGVAYFPKTDMVLRGVAETGPSQCSKLVTNSFRINGDVTLKQNATGCENQKVAQYRTWPHLMD